MQNVMLVVLPSTVMTSVYTHDIEALGAGFEYPGFSAGAVSFAPHPIATAQHRNASRLIISAAIVRGGAKRNQATAFRRRPSFPFALPKRPANGDFDSLGRGRGLSVQTELGALRVLMRCPESGIEQRNAGPNKCKSKKEGS